MARAGGQQPSLLCKSNGASGDAEVNRPMEAHAEVAAGQRNDLSRSVTALDMDTTSIAVVEMSLSSWLVAGIVPGVEPPEMQGVFLDRASCDRQRSCVRPCCAALTMPLAGMAMRGSAPEQNGELEALWTPLAGRPRSPRSRAHTVRRAPHIPTAGSSCCVSAQQTAAAGSW